jgi:hypothetical protein
MVRVAASCRPHGTEDMAACECKLRRALDSSHTCRSCQCTKGGDGAGVSQTGRRLLHRRGVGASATKALRQEEKSANEYKPNDQTLSRNGDPSPSKRAGANPNSRLTLALVQPKTSRHFERGQPRMGCWPGE